MLLFFFALSIGIGAIGAISSQDFGRYERIVLGCAFPLTSSPLYIVLELSSESLRRIRLRRGLTSLVVILFSCASALILYYAPRVSDSERWDGICLAYGYASAAFRNIAPIILISSMLVFEALRALAWVLRRALRRHLTNRGFHRNFAGETLVQAE